MTINSDDALVFGVGVSEEFMGLYQAGVFTAAELDRIRCWSLEATPPPHGSRESCNE